jgi:hypothetical protein
MLTDISVDLTAYVMSVLACHVLFAVGKHINKRVEFHRMIVNNNNNNNNNNNINNNRVY